MRCKHIKANGEQCKANAMSRLDYCYLHNPKISEEEKKEANKKGGLNRAKTIKQPLPSLVIKEPGDTVTLLIDTINRVRAGDLDIKVANCIGFLTEKLIRAFELNKQETTDKKIDITIEIDKEIKKIENESDDN